MLVNQRRVFSTSILAVAIIMQAIGCQSGGRSQDHDDVMSTVQSFFDAMATRDAETSQQVLYPDGVFVNIRQTEDGPTLRHFTNRSYIDGLPNQEDNVFESFVGQPTVLIDGDLATVWTEYMFEVNGELSHTGFDSFNLIRTPGGWKIVGGAYSVVRPGD